MHLPLLLSLLLLLAATDSVEGFRTSASETRHRPSSALRLSNTPNPFESIQSIFSPKSGSPPSRAIPDAVVDPDYKLAAGFGAAGAATIALDQAGVVGSAFGGFLCLLALLFAVQGTRIRFVFDQDSFELKQVGEGELDDSGENIVVGGKNRWSYESFVNWRFFPSKEFPILVYFKETQTSPDGQIHFFPAFANVDQLNDQFELRGCAQMDNN